jgi:predicted ATPase
MLEVKSVAVRYVRRNTNGSTIEPIVVNGSGEFVEGWPEGFMPDRLKELL